MDGRRLHGAGSRGRRLFFVGPEDAPGEESVDEACDLTLQVGQYGCDGVVAGFVGVHEYGGNGDGIRDRGVGDEVVDRDLGVDVPSVAPGEWGIELGVEFDEEDELGVLGDGV